MYKTKIKTLEKESLKSSKSDKKQKKYAKVCTMINGILRTIKLWKRKRIIIIDKRWQLLFRIVNAYQALQLLYFIANNQYNLREMYAVE